MPGDPFKRSEVLRSQQNIYNLGYFDDVSLDYQRLGDTAPDIDLTYKVKEKFAGNVGAGVSYSATDGIVGNVSFSHPNMFGRGQQMNVTVEYGKKVTNFQFGYTEPWLFDTPTSLGAELTWMTQAWDNFDKRDRGGDLNFSRPLPLDYSRAYLTLHGGDVTLSDIKTGTTANPGDTFPETTISTTLRFDRDSRDYIFNPSSGSYSSYSIELAGADVAGDVNYIRQTFESDFYYPLFWKFVLRFRGRFGIVGGWRSADTVPPYELFFPGGTGDDAVRGYPDRSLPNLVGANPGGLAEAIFSVEYRLKLSRSIALLAFYDAGNAWSSLRDINLSDLKRGVGAGVRLEIPMLGWLGFDLGYGFDRPGTASKFEPHLQIGTGFPLSF
jgi:outer membrane protein insertion porin family